jgi:hypothetical protein
MCGQLKINLPSADLSIQLRKLNSLTTSLPDYFRNTVEDDDDDNVTSVIHAPEGYGSFVSRVPSPHGVRTDTFRKIPILELLYKPHETLTGRLLNPMRQKSRRHH